jgi:hypothetical protein
VYEPIRWLPFWRPRIVVKRGRFSPWFWPFLWLTKSGAFNLFFLVIVSEDLLGCPPSHRRAIIAHECGHLSRLHFLIWAAAGAVVLKNTAIRSGFAWIGAHMGPWVAVGAFALFLISSLIGFRALLYWFEHQADDYAVARVGPDAVVGALSWLRAMMFWEKDAPWIDARIGRLRLLHGIAQ